MAQNSKKIAKGRRGSGKRFVKGQSGNPGGRPKLSPEFKEALDDLEPVALEVLRLVMERHPSSPEAGQAARYILNRKYGNPPDSLKLTAADQGPTKVFVNLIPTGFRDQLPEGEPPREP